MCLDSLREQALRKTVYLMSHNIPDCDFRKLKNYINLLSENELKNYIEIAQRLYDRKTISKSNRIKISPNAVKLCLKLADEGCHTFPYIEKLATKGWSTSDGTYSFSMPLLEGTGAWQKDIFSFGPIEKLIKKDTILDIGYSYHGALEVDYK